ncbi:MAG TPA: N-acetylglucosamine-specific PTS transporter subunit IIBC [Ktedonobacteraceae bacterium]|jgi:PTS system N-acetylglucosamine-specific IIC component
MSAASTASQPTFSDRLLGAAQSLGRSLMLPIAVLPAAALLLRLGQPDLWAWTQNASLVAGGIPWMAQAGNALFANLPMIFAVGIAIGLTGDAGAGALAGLVGFLVFTGVWNVTIPQLKGAPDPSYNMGVLSGLLTGLVAAWLYRRFHDIRLPDYLAFFGGKRFVPIITAFVCLILGLIFGWIWGPVQSVINALGQDIVSLGATGAGIYGFFNRLLIPLGLHHVLNSYFWFELGSFPGSHGLVNGDLNRYFAGDPTAGNYMAGFFPVMMFGLPGAAFAMIRRAKFSKVAAGILLSAAFCSFLTGVTEPIEFAFIFVAPILFVVHALLTGLSLLICNLLQIRIGFGFSAGLIDYVLNFTKANSNNAWLILPLGAIYFAVYYTLFSTCIKIFNIGTPGRGEERTGLAADWILPESQRGPRPTSNGSVAVAEEEVDQEMVLAAQLLEALGGRANLESVEGCITRLRLFVRESAQVDDTRLKALGASGVVKRGKIVQVVMGTQSDRIAERIKRLMRADAQTAG